MMTESVANNHHMNNNSGNPKGYDTQSLLDKNSGGGDDLGWKAKLKIPPKDNRIKTSVSIPSHRLLIWLITIWNYV